MAGPTLLITCEHAGREVPAEYAELFGPHQALLATHRGYDPGALPLARRMAEHFERPLHFAMTTRLLVEPNRSPHNPRIFSSITRGLSRSERAGLIERYHTPHWERIRQTLDQHLAEGRRVVHVGVHTFTPVLQGVERQAEIGLLYDPRRLAEKAFCRRWGAALRQRHPGLRVRFNYPYRGSADGLTTALRKAYPAERYLGIELEVSQGLLDSNERFPLEVTEAIIGALEDALASDF